MPEGDRYLALFDAGCCTECLAICSEADDSDILYECTECDWAGYYPWFGHETPEGCLHITDGENL